MKGLKVSHYVKCAICNDEHLVASRKTTPKVDRLFFPSPEIKFAQCPNCGSERMEAGK